MSISFRYALAEEVPVVGRLASHSFPAASRPPEWWTDQLQRPLYGGGHDSIWVGEEAGGGLAAACQMHPLQQWIAGESLPCMGLGTVAIAPTHRRRGLAGQLVTAGLRAARERGDLVSALYPFRISFYARLGYGLAGEALQYRVAPDCFPDSDERLRVELVDGAPQRAEVREAYAAWAPTQTGQVQRTTRLWEHLLSPADRALFAYRGASGRVEGYALLIYRTDLAPQDRFLEVEELVCTTDAARSGLYAFLGSLGDQWRQILLRARPSDRLADRLQEPRLPPGAAPGWGLWFPAATLLYGPMFRLVDLAGAWARRRVEPDVSLTVALDVQDEQIADNAGPWRLRLQGGRAVAERGGAGTADLSLRLSVSTLSRLFVSALTPGAAVAAGLAEADRPQLLPSLERALRLPEPWTFDRF